MTIPMGTAWEDEDENIYLVAAPDATSLAVKRRMLKHARQTWAGPGDTFKLEGEPALRWLREPEDDENEEWLPPAEPDDPRAFPCWVAPYFVQFGTLAEERPS